MNNETLTGKMFYHPIDGDYLIVLNQEREHFYTVYWITDSMYMDYSIDDMLRWIHDDKSLVEV